MRCGSGSGLEVRTRDVGAGTPPLSRVEVQRQTRTRQESDRERLRRTVRAVATAARSESEFLVLAREHGVIVRPRWETGAGRTTVVGYSVARPSAPGSGEYLVWFGGGKLGKDLTLPALREGWDPDPAAVASWRAVDTTGARPAGTTPTVHPAGGVASRATVGALDQSEVAARTVAAVREQLRAAPVGDVRARSAAARDGAGVLAATAEGLTGGGRVRVGMAAHAVARAVARAVDKEPGVHVRRPVGEGRLSIAARTVLTVTAAASDGVGTAVLLTQMVRLTESIREAHAQAGRLVLARAAAEAAECNVAALARIGGPRELGSSPDPRGAGLALAMEQARRATGQRITPGLTPRDQPVPGARKDTDRGMERRRIGGGGAAHRTGVQVDAGSSTGVGRRPTATADPGDAPAGVGGVGA